MALEICLFEINRLALDAAGRILKSHESSRFWFNHYHLIGSPKDRCSRPVLPLIQGRVCENM